MFLRPLLPYRQQTAVLDLRVRFLRPQSFAGLNEFLDRLDPFLAALPPEFRYAVEIRNPEFLEKDYFASSAAIASRTYITRGRGCPNCGSRCRFPIPRPPIS